MEVSGERRAALRSLASRATEYVEALPQRTTGLDVAVVGGAVRDALLGTETRDLDFLVLDASVEELLDRGFEDGGAASFGVVHDANRGEWALARRESKTGAGYKGLTVETDGVTLREDLERRDLRVNAMALLIGTNRPPSVGTDEAVRLDGGEPTATLVDPFGGLGDLAAGRLHHVTEAFREDPLRVLRTARYASRLAVPSAGTVTGSGDESSRKGERGDRRSPTPDEDDAVDADVDSDRTFEVAPATASLMRAAAPELNRTSRDRIGEEVRTAMAEATAPWRFWEVLADVGALAVVAPPLDRARIVPAGPETWHAEGDTFSHTMEVLERMHEWCVGQDIVGTDRVRRYMMVIAHDLGKVVVAEREGGLHSGDPPRRFPDHASAGVPVADRLADRLGLPAHVGAAMVDAADRHMELFGFSDWAPDRLLEFVEDHDPPAGATTPPYATVEELLDLIMADHRGRWQRRSAFDDPEAFEADPDLPEGVVRPQFHREPYVTAVERTRTAFEDVTGYDALRSGLCADHAAASPSDDTLAETARECEDCRSPGAWVGEWLTETRREYVESGAVSR